MNPVRASIPSWSPEAPTRVADTHVGQVIPPVEEETPIPEPLRDHTRYRVTRLLGKGGMGAVYEAEHRGTKRRVALKVIVSAALAKEDGVLARFQREARASGSIDSAHVVQVLDTGIEPTTGDPYMVMEYLSGEDVHDLGEPIHRVVIGERLVVSEAEQRARERAAFGGPGGDAEMHRVVRAQDRDIGTGFAGLLAARGRGVRVEAQ